MSYKKSQIDQIEKAIKNSNPTGITTNELAKKLFADGVRKVPFKYLVIQSLLATYHIFLLICFVLFFIGMMNVLIMPWVFIVFPAILFAAIIAMVIATIRDCKKLEKESK